MLRHAKLRNQLVLLFATCALTCALGCSDDSSPDGSNGGGDDPVAEACELLAGDPQVLEIDEDTRETTTVEDAVDRHLQVPFLESDGSLGTTGATVRFQLEDAGEYLILASMPPDVERPDGTLPKPWDYRASTLQDYRAPACEAATFSGRFEFQPGEYLLRFYTFGDVAQGDFVVLELEERHDDSLGAAAELSAGVIDRFIDFPKVRDIGESQEVSKVISNIGGEPLEVTGIDLTGSGSDAFELVESPELPVSLEPKEGFPVDIRYTGTLNDGPEFATLEFTWQGASEERISRLEVTGNALTTELFALPDELRFFEVPEGTTSRPQLVAMTNLGTLPVTIDSVSLSGSTDFSLTYPQTTDPEADPADDAQSVSFPAEVAPGEEFPLRVYFMPSTTESVEGQVDIDGTVPITIPLIGNIPL